MYEVLDDDGLRLGSMMACGWDQGAAASLAPGDHEGQECLT
jgi:hypothetical protein